MATSAIAGYKGVMAASTSTGGSFSEIAEVRNFNITVEMAEIDATSHDSSGDREVIAGTGSWNATADYIQVMASTDHQAIFDVLVGRTKVLAEWYPTGSSSDGYYTGEGFFNNWEMASPNDDALTASVGFVGSGALTRSASSS
jgi:predicted secreted protein